MTATVHLLSGSGSRLHGRPQTNPLGFLRSGRARPRPVAGCGEVGRAWTQLPSDLGVLPDPASRGSLPGGSPSTRGAWLSRPSGPSGLLQDPARPGARANPGLERKPAAAAGALSGPSGLPSGTLSAAHLLGRHRPLPRAAPAALAGATAAFRHLRRLRGFRRAARRLGHFRNRGPASSLGTPPIPPASCARSTSDGVGCVYM